MSSPNDTSIPTASTNSSSAAVAISPYLVYLGIAENVVCFTALGIALPIMLRLLLDAYSGTAHRSDSKRVRISRSMVMFLLAHLVFGVMSMPSYVYNVAATLWPLQLLSPVWAVLCSCWLGLSLLYGDSGEDVLVGDLGRGLLRR